MPPSPSRSPVHRLPAELIASIFLRTLPEPDGIRAVDPRRAQALLRSVCRHWRAVAENTAAFWSMIFIRLPYLSDESIAIEMLENAERWSANNALSIYVARIPRDDPRWFNHVDASQKFISTMLRLLPRTALLYLDTDAAGTGVDVLFPIRNAPLLRSLILGFATCYTMDSDHFFEDNGTMSPLDIFSYREENLPDDCAFLYRASPQKLFLDLSWIDTVPMKVIGTISTLQYLHLTGALETRSRGWLSSSSIISLDIEFCHDSLQSEEIDVLGSLPKLTHLVIRVTASPYCPTVRYSPAESQHLPELPALKTVTIGNGPDMIDGHLYPFCDCLAPIMARAPNLAALEVQQGHALSSLQQLDGVGKKRGSKDASCPNLELLRVVFTDHNAKDRPAISQSCVRLLEDRPSLAVEWQEHRTLKLVGREGEGDDSDSDDEVLSWRKVPDGVKHGVRYLGDGPEGSLASLYSPKDL